MRVVPKTATGREFFSRGRELARRADVAAAPAERHMVGFEDPADPPRLLSAARPEAFRAVQEQPGSITGPAERPHRDRTAVERDVDQLVRTARCASGARPRRATGA